VSIRVLIADDEPFIREDLKELLVGIGYDVVAVAKDGREAMEMIGLKRPDVLILDIKMPHLTGIELARRYGNSYPTIILTAYSDRYLIEQARDAGIMAYLVKPFRESDLSPAIELAVARFVEKSRLAERVARLSEQLETRKVVDKAKGLLMASEHLTESAAYRRIQEISMKKNRPMKEVAEAIILMLS